jgi:hypothetical protein
LVWQQTSICKSDYKFKAFVADVISEILHSQYKSLFMTTSPCVTNAGAVRETLSEGKADYCIIECE